MREEISSMMPLLRWISPCMTAECQCNTVIIERSPRGAEIRTRRDRQLEKVPAIKLHCSCAGKMLTSSTFRQLSTAIRKNTPPNTKMDPELQRTSPTDVFLFVFVFLTVLKCFRVDVCFKLMTTGDKEVGDGVVVGIWRR